jgi:hypothetical protein
VQHELKSERSAGGPEGTRGAKQGANCEMPRPQGNAQENRVLTRMQGKNNWIIPND